MSCYNRSLVLFVILNVTVYCVNSVALTDGNGTKPGNLNGEKLMEIGKDLKLPLLQMIGKTIDTIEKEIEEKICDFHHCSEWTEWSRCTPGLGQFGSKFRTRRCSVSTTSCEIDSNSRTEKEFGICIGLCRNRYILTKNGFCMKLYDDKTRPKAEVEQQCQKDGGHLVNIDSEMKLEDVGNLLTGFKSGAWIDGHRKDVSSAWEYTYGSQTGFFKWYPGQPSNKLEYNCLVIGMYGIGVKWHDWLCESYFFSICEISSM